MTLPGRTSGPRSASANGIRTSLDQPARSPGSVALRKAATSRPGSTTSSSPSRRAALVVPSGWRIVARRMSASSLAVGQGGDDGFDSTGGGDTVHDDDVESDEAPVGGGPQRVDLDLGEFGHGPDEGAERGDGGGQSLAVDPGGPGGVEEFVEHAGGGGLAERRRPHGHGLEVLGQIPAEAEQHDRPEDRVA